ncbi:glycoside hydrolase [Mycolicibacterium sp. S2-37]|uniref:glycoside hydrolase n=1 Tax=Mycolicibacterium sp. S2-37 TaxID=2810297 RepID=UPI001A9502F1|nr:glycoside hydrolase [Mycolicibacterium sp. S2-37]MBO0679619.1 glycoside hydrolase [Mycolicibacterium sp. S2-37]
MHTVGKGLLANGRGKLLALVASVVVCIASFYAQAGTSADKQAAAAVPAQPVAPAAAPTVAGAPAELLAANAPDLPAAALPFALPKGVAPEGGLQVRTIWVARAISAMYPEITTIGGYRQDALPWHPNGLAIDVMIPDHDSEAGIELGNEIAGLALANAERWGVRDVIWRQGYYPGVGAPSWMADYGSETLNHFDHVHISTIGGGYPTGREAYFVGSMTPPPS